MNLTQRVNSVGENAYEVVLTVTVTCKIGEKTAYLAWVQIDLKSSKVYGR